MHQRTSLIIVGALVLAGCEATQKASNPAETDEFLQNAFDTYGVIEVIPNAPLGEVTESNNEPLSAISDSPTRRVSVDEACAGKSGIQRGLRDTRTGRWLDCGSNKATPAS